VAYWGASEPLGQSLVLPAVVRLKERGVDLTLMTFDKPHDYDDPAARRAVGDLLGTRGIGWLSLRYHQRPRLPATAFDVLQGWARGLRAALRSPVDLVHARTYVGGVIGRLLAPTLRARLVYHNEGFYPDEQVDGGFWTEGSSMHRLTKAIERDLYARADGLIALSDRARAELEAFPSVRRRGTPVITVPSCVDLERFRWFPDLPRVPRDPLRFVYTGAVGGRYELDRIGRFLAVAAREGLGVRLRVLTRAEPSLAAEMLARGGLLREAWSLDCLPHSAMPAELRDHHVGLFFLARGRSEHGCSPTKIGEYWACGLPVVTSPNVSDTDEIIARKRVGVVVADHSDEGYRRAIRELRSLLEDPDLPRRCRVAAEEHYALAPAVERQLELYRSLLARGPRAETEIQRTASDERS
jgi:glycosyltransferase involved in cell wall biosynthesis